MEIGRGVSTPRSSPLFMHHPFPRCIGSCVKGMHSWASPTCTGSYRQLPDSFTFMSSVRFSFPYSWPSPFHLILLQFDTKLRNVCCPGTLLIAGDTKMRAPPSSLFSPPVFSIPLVSCQTGFGSQNSVWAEPDPTWAPPWTLALSFPLSSRDKLPCRSRPWATYLLCDASCLNLYLL